MTKLIFVLPSYSDQPTNHYGYLLEEINWLKDQVDLKVVVEKTYSPLPSWLKSISYAPSNFISRAKILLKLKRLGYKKIYLHYSHFTLILAKLLGFTTYFWHCEIYKNFPHTWLVILALHLTDYLVTGDEMIKQAYISRFGLKPDKILVVPNWVKPAPKLTSKLNLPKNKLKVLFVHHLSPRKGSRLLPEIIKKTTSKNPNLMFYIIGSGPDQTWLQTQLTGLPVKLIGSLPQEELVKYYQACDLFILPSVQEGFPRVILEAMATNLPIISFPVGNVTKLLPSNQLVTSVPEMVSAILRPIKPVKYPNLSQYSFISWQKAFKKAIL